MITGEIIGFQESNDVQKNIMIYVQFKKDGAEIPFYLDGELVLFKAKKCWPYHARWQNFVGKNAAQITTWVQAQIEHQIDNLIKAGAMETVNSDLIANTLTAQVGKSYQKSSTTYTDPDTSTTVTIAEDGTIS